MTDLPLIAAERVQCLIAARTFLRSTAPLERPNLRAVVALAEWLQCGAADWVELAGDLP